MLIIHHHGARDDHHTNAPTHIYIEAAADLFSSNITIILSSPCGEEDELLLAEVAHGDFDVADGLVELVFAELKLIFGILEQLY